MSLGLWFTCFAETFAVLKSSERVCFMDCGCLDWLRAFCLLSLVIIDLMQKRYFI